MRNCAIRGICVLASSACLAQSIGTIAFTGDDKALAQEVLEMKRKYDEAQSKNDSAWFDRNFAEGYVFVLPDSTVVTKTEFVNDLKTRDLVWRSVMAKDMEARVYGNTAIVSGRFYGKGKYKGKDLNERQRFTSVWIKRDGRWLAISEHASTLKESEQ